MASATKDGDHLKPDLSPKDSTDGDPNDIPAQGRPGPASEEHPSLCVQPKESKSKATRPPWAPARTKKWCTFFHGTQGKRPGRCAGRARWRKARTSWTKPSSTRRPRGFYLVGQDIAERNFRILKIDRTSPPGQLSIFEDANVYDRQSINELLITIEEGNKGSGGLKTRFNACSAGIYSFH